jgi:hypothetical protein
MGIEKILCFFSRMYAGGRVCCGVVVLAGMMMGLLSGCSLPEHESLSYSVPNWTSDGQIIARQVYVKTKETLTSKGEMVSYRNSIVLMNDDGSDVQELFEVNENGIQRIEMSPQGTYVGYVNALGELKVCTRGGALVGGVTPNPPVTYFKFSPDETKIYGSEDYASMVLFSVSDLSVLSQNSLGGWGGFVDNGNIFFYKTSGGSGGVSVYTIATQQIAEFHQGFISEVYVSSENAVYGLGSDKVYRYELGEESYTEVGFSWDPYEYNDFTGKHVSPDGKKIVMSYDSIEDVGIYVLTVENSQVHRIK